MGRLIKTMLVTFAACLFGDMHSPEIIRAT